MVMKKQKGFTLIELLVVIAIIGLLSTLAVIALNNARSKARDARRVSDIKQIQSAMELYYNDSNQYPGTPNGTTAVDIGDNCLSSDGFAATCTGSTIYMTKVPANPEPGAMDYEYVNTGAVSTSGRTYALRYELEGTTGGVTVGVNTATQAGLWGGEWPE